MTITRRLSPQLQKDLSKKMVMVSLSLLELWRRSWKHYCSLRNETDTRSGATRDITSKYSEADSDDLWVTWSVSKWSAVRLEFAVSVRSDYDGSNDEWVVTCGDVARFNLRSHGDGLYYVLDDEHPLVRHWISPSASLHCIRGEHAGRVFAERLLLAHKDSVGEWFRPGEFLNTKNGGLDLENWDYGVLAEGPQFLLEEYARAISGHCEKFNMYGVHLPRDWDGEKFVERPKMLTGICFGESYVLCKNVKEELVNP